MPALLIFIDGLGIGSRGPHNPLDAIDSPFFSIMSGEEPDLPFDGRLAITDACLGVEGLPQSATGQATILTGENGPALIGRHLSGFPSPRLRDLISQHSIYKKLKALGCSVTFANAYMPLYFESRPRFVSATTVAAESAGVRLRTLEDLERGDAVYHDFTNRYVAQRGYYATERSPEEAGGNLARIAAAHDFTLYEHFITDRIGHNQDYEAARAHLELLNRFVWAVLEGLDLERHSVVITSDHGNLEDLSTSGHTMNPVGTLVFGRVRDRIQRIRSLTDIAPRIIESISQI
ncbi:MAG TPA: peptidase [Blastocatellia bacterium]|nr:peptidase [Blastocatellia bacterium]